MIPETRYAKTADGYHIAYQSLGDEPTDIVLVDNYFTNVEHDHRDAIRRSWASWPQPRSSRS